MDGNQANPEEELTGEDYEALRLKEYLDDLVFHDTGIEMELDYYKAVIRFINGEDFKPQITDYEEVLRVA